MLGLKKGHVELCNHEDAWEENARSTIETLKKLFGALAVDIQHVGSTAIKHIMAKPIIDIVVGINDFIALRRMLPYLESKGLVHRPNNDLPGYMMFVLGDMEKEIRTHHIHVVKYGEEEWCNQLNFRDYLNTNHEVAKEYEALKLQLMIRYKDDRAAYTNGKDRYIKNIFEKAKRHFGSR